MAGPKNPDVTDVPAGQPFEDEDRKTVVSPDGAVSTFGTAKVPEGEDVNVVTTVVESMGDKLTKKEQAAIFDASQRPEDPAVEAEPLPTAPEGGGS